MNRQGGTVIPLHPLKTEASPRSISARHFSRELPIHGGWGYSKNDACIINTLDPTFDPEEPFHGTVIEELFVEMRICEEMIIQRTEGEKCAGIEWSQLSRERIEEGARHFDRLTFEIRAFPVKDWEELKADYEGPTGAASPCFDHEAHEMKRQERVFFVTREFWFDTSSFAGQGTALENIVTKESGGHARGDAETAVEAGRESARNDEMNRFEPVAAEAVPPPLSGCAVRKKPWWKFW